MYEQFFYLLDKQEKVKASLIQMGYDTSEARKAKAEKDLKIFIFMVINNGDVDFLNLIISNYPSVTSTINSEVDENGHTALNLATLNGNFQMVSFLISHGANDKRVEDQLTSLEALVLKSKIPFDENTKKIIELLLPFAINSDLNLFLDFLRNSEDEYPGTFGEFSNFLSGYSPRSHTELYINLESIHSPQNDHRIIAETTPVIEQEKEYPPSKKLKTNNTNEELKLSALEILAGCLEPPYDKTIL